MTNKKDESYDDPIVATAIALLGFGLVGVGSELVATLQLATR